MSIDSSLSRLRFDRASEAWKWQPKALTRHLPNRMNKSRNRIDVAMKRRKSVMAAIVTAATLGAVAQMQAPPAGAVPAPEVEYTYDVVARRHYQFPSNDAIGYGYGSATRSARRAVRERDGRRQGRRRPQRRAVGQLSGLVRGWHPVPRTDLAISKLRGGLSTARGVTLARV